MVDESPTASHKRQTTLLIDDMATSEIVVLQKALIASI